MPPAIASVLRASLRMGCVAVVILLGGCKLYMAGHTADYGLITTGTGDFDMATVTMPFHMAYDGLGVTCTGTSHERKDGVKGLTGGFTCSDGRTGTGKSQLVGTDSGTGYFEDSCGNYLQYIWGMDESRIQQELARLRGLRKSVTPAATDKCAQVPSPPTQKQAELPTPVQPLPVQKHETLRLAEKRIALVIGNGAYGKAIGALPNPPNDARLMARSLRSIGFEVIEHINIDQKAMKRAISRFGKALSTAGKDAVGLFYYAGHGVQVDGANYLVPLKVNIETEADVDIEAVSANGVLGQMAYADNRLNIIIMDACRNNPFKRGFRSVSRGLARMNASRGTLIAYATAPGDVAADGKGGNSPYTAALSKVILTPGLTVERVFKEVRNQVVAITNSAQVPWEASSLTGADFYFRATKPIKNTPAAPRPTVSTTPTIDKEVVFWQSVANSNNAGDYQAYLDQYPGGSFEALARSRIAALSKSSASTRTAAEYPFDGAWDGWLRTYGGLFESPIEATYRVSVKNGQLTGTVDMYGETRTFKAKVDQEGNLINGRLQGSLQGYDLHGTIKNGLGDGAALGWKLEYKMVRADQ